MSGWTEFAIVMKTILETLFYFRDANLRASFQTALQGDELLKGHFPEKARNFKTGVTAQELANECFPSKSEDLATCTH